MVAVPTPTFKLERELIAQGFSLIAGVDEAGCGCWAGPVYAAAVILPLDSRIGLIRDSKRLSLDQRTRVIVDIKEKATAWAVGTASHEEVDRLNIRQAAFLAMRRAIESLSIQPQTILVDGFMIPNIAIPCRRVIGGDRLVKSIAAASIIAKVERDIELERLDGIYPGYGFADHKGYGTKQHLAALKRLGATPIHRMSYKPLQPYSPTIAKPGTGTPP
ncbi:ribonuclease HII [Candidatus Uhrbacteria bacterium]|nr:ribonuclease HII [Candidatus Uhrbacteria bacterium]